MGTTARNFFRLQVCQWLRAYVNKNIVSTVKQSRCQSEGFSLEHYKAWPLLPTQGTNTKYINHSITQAQVKDLTNRMNLAKHKATWMPTILGRKIRITGSVDKKKSLISLWIEGTQHFFKYVVTEFHQPSVSTFYSTSWGGEGSSLLIAGPEILEALRSGKNEGYS